MAHSIQSSFYVILEMVGRYRHDRRIKAELVDLECLQQHLLAARTELDQCLPG